LAVAVGLSGLIEAYRPFPKEYGMRKWFVRLGVAVIVVLIAVQFAPLDTTNPPVEQDIPASPEVKAVLRRACYDCHSNETVWPWYSRIALISWLIVRDVQEGREELNFSTWNRYSTKEQVKKLKESWEEVQEGKMPPWFYLAVHRDVRLAEADRALVRQWALQP
jgi:hypothetical protein